MPTNLILVTGASGFVGCHILDQLLKEDYRVRALARGVKAEQLKSSYAKFKDFEVLNVSDIAVDQFPEAFKDVHAVVHAAAVLPSRNFDHDIKEMIRIAIEGTMNVLRQGYAAGVRKFMVVSSITTVLHPATTLSHKDWNPTTSMDSISTDQSAMDGYGVAKTLAERAMWDWADQHSNVEITTVHPPWVYGPPSSRWVAPETPNYWPLLSNLLIAAIMKPDGLYPPDPPYVDVRDTASAVVRGLRCFKPAPAGERNRVVFMAPQFFDSGRARALILERHPEVKDRLITKDAPPFLGPAPLEYEWMESVLNFKKEDFCSFEETILDTVDYILNLEADWRAKGYEPVIPDPTILL